MTAPRENHDSLDCIYDERIKLRWQHRRRASGDREAAGGRGSARQKKRQDLFVRAADNTNDFISRQAPVRDKAGRSGVEESEVKIRRQRRHPVRHPSIVVRAGKQNSRLPIRIDEAEANRIRSAIHVGDPVAGVFYVRKRKLVFASRKLALETASHRVTSVGHLAIRIRMAAIPSTKRPFIYKRKFQEWLRPDKARPSESVVPESITDDDGSLAQRPDRELDRLLCDWATRSDSIGDQRNVGARLEIRALRLVAVTRLAGFRVKLASVKNRLLFVRKDQAAWLNRVGCLRDGDGDGDTVAIGEMQHLHFKWRLVLYLRVRQ